MRIYLFGAWGRGEQKRSSDIDIALESRDDISYELTLLRERLEESTISRQVDVVDMHHAGAA
ncbi:nucleotidyltransferase domain-containing protein, partial [Megasphaera massiliensis]|uniref:nucleotidyltransferase domain-containing protein n=1 Tax=Megasphaera massiliensis TaxID=1232428 RepID=UPI003523B044